MRGAWRWLVVAVGVLALVATPAVVSRLPVGGSDLAGAELLEKVQSSVDTPYSGYAQATGGVTLPVTDSLGALPDLLGDTTTLRTWFRGPENWRVDTVRLAGERDLYRDGEATWRWDYEQNTAVLVPDAQTRLRLPREADVLPTTLGHRLLSEAGPDEVSTLPARRVAGRDAPGLRLVPTAAATTITAVDVWVEPDTGLPLRVDVRGDARRPVISTAFLDFSGATPAPERVTFTPPPGAQVRVEEGTDIASFADQLDTAAAPSELAGLASADRGVGGSVGVYGRGVTTLVAVPLPRRAARGLADQLTRAPGSVTDDDGVGLAVGPLSLRLAPPTDGDGADGRQYLLAGTVTPETLITAARTLTTGAA